MKKLSEQKVTECQIIEMFFVFILFSSLILAFFLTQSCDANDGSLVERAEMHSI